MAIGWSLRLQVQELRHAREQAARTTQNELMRMLLDEPLYRAAVGGGPDPDVTEDEFRQGVYLNLLLNAWQLRWEFGDMDEREVRAIAESEIFCATPGHDYWRRFGAARLAAANTRRARNSMRFSVRSMRRPLRADRPVLRGFGRFGGVFVPRMSRARWPWRLWVSLASPYGVRGGPVDGQCSGCGKAADSALRTSRSGVPVRSAARSGR